MQSLFIQRRQLDCNCLSNTLLLSLKNFSSSEKPPWNGLGELGFHSQVSTLESIEFNFHFIVDERTREVAGLLADTQLFVGLLFVGQLLVLSRMFYSHFLDFRCLHLGNLSVVTEPTVLLSSRAPELPPLIITRINSWIGQQLCLQHEDHTEPGFRAYS